MPPLTGSSVTKAPRGTTPVTVDTVEVEADDGGDADAGGPTTRSGPLEHAA